MAARTLVVVNPAAGAGRTAREWPDLERRIRSVLGELEVHHTTADGLTADVVRESLRGGVDRVVSVGGDGTNHEAVNGFFDPVTRAAVRPDARYGFVPTGTGSDFGRTFGLTADVDATLARIAASPGRPVDLMGCAFESAAGPAWQITVNAASLGQGGDLVRRVHRWKHLARGRLPFILAGIEGAVQVRPWLVELIVDDAEAEPVTLRNLTICNGRFQGGGMDVAPMGAPDDGRLELIVMGAMGALRSIRVGLSSYDGRMLQQPGVWHRTVRSVEVRPVPGQAPMYLELDGEQPGRAPVRFDVLPGALRLAI